MTKSYKQETRYILDCIDSEGYGIECNTDKDKALFLWHVFNKEYGWSIERYGLQRALREWLQGLPSSVNIAFMNYEILELYKKWNGIESMTEKEEDKILSMYWNFMAMRILGLWRKYKVQV